MKIENSAHSFTEGYEISDNDIKKVDEPQHNGSWIGALILIIIIVVSFGAVKGCRTEKNIDKTTRAND